MNLRFFFGLLLPFWLLACDSGEAQPEIAYAQDQPGAPALWHAQGRSGEAYLFGTIHVLPPDTAWRTDAFDEAAAKSERLMLEISPDESADAIRDTFTAMAKSSDAIPLLDRIDPALREDAQRIFADHDISVARFIHMKSWGAAVVITGSMAQPTGALRENAPEQWLTTAFQKRSAPVLALESPSTQFAYFDDLDEADQRAMLNAVIKDEDTTAADYNSLLQDWLAGNVDAIAEITSTGVLARPDIRNALVTRRNMAWSDAIGTLMDTRAGTTFVAVGAGHLAGPDALQTMLAARGYKVTRVQ